jgi:Flp pilus assembly protein TadB
MSCLKASGGILTASPLVTLPTTSSIAPKRLLNLFKDCNGTFDGNL